jgi:hypothetical protein
MKATFEFDGIMGTITGDREFQWIKWDSANCHISCFDKELQKVALKALTLAIIKGN